MPAVFISYRRSDSQDITGRIFDRLTGHFSSKPVSIIRDVDSIPVGEDFRDVLRERIQECDVVLVIIGPSWTTTRDSKGNRRLDDATDTVRIEIEQALELKKKVIPICVTHATMPTEDDLPQPIKNLAFRNGVQVRPDPDFHTDIGRLIGALDKLLKEKMVAEAKRPTAPPPVRSTPQIPEPPPPPAFGAPHPSAGSHHGAPAPASSFGPAHRGGASGAWPQPKALHVPGGGPSGQSQPPQQSQHPQHASPSQPHVRPPAAGSKSSGSFFATTAGVIIALVGVATVCVCGGGYGIYSLAMLGGRSYASDVREDVKNHPAILEHVGDIVSIEHTFMSSGLPRAPNGDSSMLFKVIGTKGNADIIGHSEYVNGDSKMLGDTLRLPSGEMIPLRGDSAISGGGFSGKK